MRTSTNALVPTLVALDTSRSLGGGSALDYLEQQLGAVAADPVVQRSTLLGVVSFGPRSGVVHDRPRPGEPPRLGRGGGRADLAPALIELRSVHDRGVAGLREQSTANLPLHRPAFYLITSGSSIRSTDWGALRTLGALAGRPPVLLVVDRKASSDTIDSVRDTGADVRLAVGRRRDASSTAIGRRRDAAATAIDVVRWAIEHRAARPDATAPRVIPGYERV